MNRKGGTVKFNHYSSHSNSELMNPCEESNVESVKIVLRKIDSVEKSPDVCEHDGVSLFRQSDNFLFLSPKLTLRRIDPFLPFAENTATISSCFKESEVNSLQHFYSSCSASALIINNQTEKFQNISTQNVATTSMHQSIKDEFITDHRSRAILKDVKNTSELSIFPYQEVRKNILHGLVQSNFKEQENVPFDSQCETKPNVMSHEFCVKLTQLDENQCQRHLLENKFTETTSTHNSIADSMRAGFESLMVATIKKENVKETIPHVVIQRYGINKGVTREQAWNQRISTSTSPLKSSKRKSNNRRDHNKKQSKRTRTRLLDLLPIGSIRSSPIITRRKAAECDSIEFYQLSQKLKRKISPNVFANLDARNVNVKCAKIICENTKMPYQSPVERRHRFSESLNSIQFTKKRSNFPSMKRKKQTLMEELMELNFSYGNKKFKTEEQESSPKACNRQLKTINRARPERAPELNSSDRNYFFNDEPLDVNNLNQVERDVAYQNVPKKKASFNSDAVKIVSRDAKKACTAYVERSKIMCQSSKVEGSKPKLTYLTRNEVAKNGGSTEFYRLPWKQAKGFEIVRENQKKFSSNEACSFVTSKGNGLTDAGHLPLKTPITSLYSSTTKRNSFQNAESSKFYRLPWKKTKTLKDVQKKTKKIHLNYVPAIANQHHLKLKKNLCVVLPVYSETEEKRPQSKKGILNRNEALVSSTPFLQSAQRKVVGPNVSFTNDEANGIIAFQSETNANTFRNSPGAAMRACTTSKSYSSKTKSKKRMTKKEAHRKTILFNKNKKALEKISKSFENSVHELSSETFIESKRSSRLTNKRTNNSSIANSVSSLSEHNLMERTISTPYVRLNKLNAADISSYKITPLKEDRIPIKSKTIEDYGIDDVNTDDSTDDEEFPKKIIPQWVKDFQSQPRYQSYVNPELVFDWIKPPKYKYTLHHVFFSYKSNTFI